MPDPIYLKNHIYVTICVWRSKKCCFYILDLLPRTIKCCVSFKLGKNSAPAVSETFVIFLYLSFFLWQLFGNCSLFLYETKNGRERGIPAFFLQYLAWIQFWLQRLLEERKQTYSSRKVSLFVQRLFSGNVIGSNHMETSRHHFFIITETFSLLFESHCFKMIFAKASDMIFPKVVLLSVTDTLKLYVL